MTGSDGTRKGEGGTREQDRGRFARSLTVKPIVRHSPRHLLVSFVRLSVGNSVKFDTLALSSTLETLTLRHASLSHAAEKDFEARVRQACSDSGAVFSFFISVVEESDFVLEERALSLEAAVSVPLAAGARWRGLHERSWRRSLRAAAAWVTRRWLERGQGGTAWQVSTCLRGGPPGARGRAS